VSGVVIERFAGPGGWSTALRDLGLAGVGLAEVAAIDEPLR
jgi:hypothetical protein